MNLVSVNNPRIAARVNWGRWIIDCPRCPDALTARPGTARVACWTCGTSVEVVWPDEEFIAGLQRLLSMRWPLAHLCNWVPGESLHDLLAENVAHSIGPGPGEQIAITGDRITLDTLPPATSRLMIGA